MAPTLNDEHATQQPRAAGLSAAGPTAREPARCRRIPSSELFGPCRELEIAHGEGLYRLRITSQGKLILTK